MTVRERLAKLPVLGQRIAGPVPVGRRELQVVAAAMVIGFLARITYVLVTQDHALAGDEPEYHTTGRFLADGVGYYATTPSGEPHESLWKAPGYPVFVGILYKILGVHPDRVLAVQTLIGPIVIALTWVLGRRLFSPRVGMVAAAIVAIYPFAWQFEARLYSESIATPLVLVLLIAVLGQRPTPKRAAAVGALLGINMLVRPSSVLFLAGIALAWWIASGWKRGTAMTAVTVGVAVLVIAPWTYRNYEIQGGFVPISAQDAAGFGVFNDDAANDEDKPWAWRPFTTRERDLYARVDEITETEFRNELRERMFEYIKDNPDSVPKAFFWNGITRLWDIRRPRHALDEVPFEGRSEFLTWVGLCMYYVLLPLALYGLWRARRRREVLIPIIGIALAASAVYTLDATTRYRSPLEPLIAILASSSMVALWDRRRARVAPATPAEPGVPAPGATA